MVEEIVNEFCEHPDCQKNAIYELYWEAIDQDGNPAEPDDDNFAYSCNDQEHLIYVAHYNGLPLDDIHLNGNSLDPQPDLVKLVNNSKNQIS